MREFESLRPHLRPHEKLPQNTDVRFDAYLAPGLQSLRRRARTSRGLTCGSSQSAGHGRASVTRTGLRQRSGAAVRHGRVRTYQLAVGGFGEAIDWMLEHRLPAERRLVRLGEVLNQPVRELPIEKE